jgi:ketosteroid isomerase-like protein
VDILATLKDERAIQRVYLRYCDVIDSKDFDRLDEVFTADCVGDYRDSHGTVQEGLAPLLVHLHTNLGLGSTCGATHHNVLNFRIDSTGDTATAVVHFYAVHRGAGVMAGKLYSVWGRYEDELLRTEQGWRICRRRYRNYVTEGDKAVIRNAVPQVEAPDSAVPHPAAQA